jgi:putative sugar O-methyltransferase
MTPKLKHLRHPLRTAQVAQALIAERLNMRRLAKRGERHFASDPRFDLQSVKDGFAPQVSDQQADHINDPRETALLERICTAYGKAAKQEQSEPKTFQATKWWQQMRQSALGPVTRALQSRDIEALRRMYRSFFRDPCSAGLVGVPYGMSKPYVDATDADRRLYLMDALYRLDYWLAQTKRRFPVRDLAGPKIGNPFGLLMEGTLIETGAEYRHYCADKVSRLLDSPQATVAEIGGGFGGMAYYLLRDRPGVKYLDFDVPESLALTAYYLASAFPHLTFKFYVEAAPINQARAGVVLLPLFELPSIPPASLDVTFISHAISDLRPPALAEYLKHIARITRRGFLYIGTEQSGQSVIERIPDPFRLVESHPSEWISHKTPAARETEDLYRRDPQNGPIR